MCGSSVPDYATRKREELDLLCQACKLALPRARLTQELVVDVKNRCRARLRARSALGAATISETNTSGSAAFALGSHALRGTYNRYDLEATHGDALASIYRYAPATTWRSFGSYTSSGMAAITALLASLARQPGRTTIAARSDIYFETVELVRTHFRTIDLELDVPQIAKGSAARRVLWIDAIEHTAFDDRAIARDDFELVVIDTTCRPLGDGRLFALIERASRAGVPCVLLRSHVKLDSLGLEYGRLGSIVFVFTTDLAHHDAAQLASLRAAHRDAIARLGLNFEPLNLFPLHHDERFHALNDRRVAVIRRNTARLGQVLADRGLAVDRYDHALFVTVRVPDVTTRAAATVRQNAMVAALTARGVAARAAGSFAFDFLAIDGYRDRTTEEERLRLSPADLDDAAAAAVAAHAADLLVVR